MKNNNIHTKRLRFDLNLFVCIKKTTLAGNAKVERVRFLFTLEE